MTTEETTTEEFDLSDATHRVHFHGRKIGDVSTDNKPHQVRWTTLELYLTAKGKYVLVVTGHSVLYHAVGSPCNSGTPITWAELRRRDDDPVPCDQCVPARDELIEMEDPFPVIHVCETAADVIDRLRQPHKQTGKPMLSRPATRLIIEAARIDPAFLPPVEEL
jgi:hypothetical protein